MKFLAIGDIVSAAGCEHLKKTLPELKKYYGADYAIINGENSAVGNGITPKSAEEIFDCGADIITLGNHALRRPEIYDYLDENSRIIRPANFHPSAPGNGIAVLDLGFAKAAVINLQGNVYLETHTNAFDCADEMLKKAEAEGCKITIIDFHAEATSEKRAMGFYLDGRASAVFGTHTHVQTSDNQILPNGTGYITDLGMTGAANSVLGIEPELAIKKMQTMLPVRFKNPEGKCVCEGCFFEIDDTTGKTVFTEAFRR